MVFFVFLGFKKLNFAANQIIMNRAKWIVLLSVVSTLMILFGALAKIQHWETLKPLMLVGIAIQFGVVVFALIPLVSKKDNQKL